MNLIGLHIDVVRNISTFFGNLVLYTHLYSSEFVNALWFSIPSFVDWELNELLLCLGQAFRDGRGRALCFPNELHSSKLIRFDEAVLAGPLIATKDVSNGTSQSVESEMTGICFPVYLHQQALEGTLFLSSDITMKIFIAQSICSIRILGVTGHVPQIVGQEIIGFVNKSNKLSTKFSLVCSQAFNGRNQLSRNLYFRLLRYNAIFAPLSKETDSAMEWLWLKQMKEAIKSFTSNFQTSEETFLRGELNLLSLCAQVNKQMRIWRAKMSQKWTVSFLWKRRVLLLRSLENLVAVIWTRQVSRR